MRALAHVAGWQAPAPFETPLPAPARIPGDPGALSEHESSEILGRYGIRFAPFRRATTPEEAGAAFTDLGGPVVVKVDGVAHKAREGGVVLHVTSAEEAQAVAERLGGRVLVAQQLEPGPEAFVGMTRDPEFGPILAVGLGGVAIEALDKAVSSAGPVDVEAARALIAEAGIDQAVDAIAAALAAVSRVAYEHPEIAEIDVNPLLLHGDEATAVDALVVLGDAVS